MKKSSVNVILSAAEKEVGRSIKSLKAPGHPRPYFVSYLIRDIEEYDIWARYGGVVKTKSSRKRNCYADVRVGSRLYDQITKGGLTENSEEDESVELIDLPQEDDEDGLRFCLWRLTDAKYREAVSRYHGRKSRDVSYLDENKGIPSFQLMKGNASIGQLKNLKVDEKKITSLVKSVSKIMKAWPEIKNSYVEFSASLTTKIYVSSEGIKRTWQEPIYSLTAYMWYHTKKCNEEPALVFNTCRFEELPSISELKRQVTERYHLLKEIEKGDKLISYTGPVLMGPRPAGLFIHEVMGHRLEGCRLLSDDEGRTFKDKVGKLVVHKSMDIFDNPGLKKWGKQTLVGHYPYDDEGVEAGKSMLVEKGVLKGFLTNRSPLSRKAHENNGHGRNQSFERPVSRMANLIITSDSSDSWVDLKKQLIEEIKRRKIPYGIILYEVEGGETGTESFNFQAFMGEITVAVKVFPDGREKYVRGVDFVGTPLSSLSNIVAVGKDLEVDNGFCGAESGYIPVSTVSPAILLANLELQAKDPNRVTQYALPLPWFDKKS